MECTTCHEDKPTSDFYKGSRKCKLCTCAAVRKNREENLDYYREYDRARSSLPHRLENARKVGSAWRKENPEKANLHRQRHPEKYKASMALNNAIRDGKIIRQRCEICGGFGEAHHHDYSKPLEVRWLCRTHHAAEHRRYERREHYD